MARAVEKAFLTGEHLIAEAGTGVGKSFAYLLPAIDAAVKRKKRVVISTHTISLQEQIVEKDVPLLRAVYGDEFSAVLVKGRGNYLCLRRLDAASRRASHLFETANERNALFSIEQWGSDTTDGDLSSLPVVPDLRVWDKVRAEAGNCMGKRCGFYKACHWQAAKRRMQTGNLLVVNHALFFSDLALRLAGVQYLPKYDHVIFDEAHTLEEVAAQHFGIKVTEGGIGYTLRHLFDVKRTKGFLTALAGQGADVAKINELISLTVDAQSIAESFFERCLSWRERYAAGNGRVRQAGFVKDDLSPVLLEMAKRLKDIAAGYGDDDENADTSKLERKLETTSQADKLRIAGESVKVIVEQAMPDAVYWIDTTPTSTPTSGRSPRRCSLHASPVDVAEGLKLALWSKTPGCVLTSATLCTAGSQKSSTVGGTGFQPVYGNLEDDYPMNMQKPVVDRKSDDGLEARPTQARVDPAFSYIRQRLGLGDETGEAPLKSSAVQFGSPFDYRKQAKLYIETGLPDPSDRRFNELSAERILHWIKHTNGGAFVLFTSYKALIDAANRLANDLDALGLTLLVQGQEAPRRLLLERFRNIDHAVLFGTASFWQGVDVRGDRLRNVIIHKLPFAVPDEPVTQARLERINATGGNPFMDYSVPEAVIKLKQGFGRLIRSGKDKGIVVLLDGRILSRRYGKAFLNALPDVEVIQVDHRLQPPPPVPSVVNFRV